MKRVLEVFPGAQRALFRRYHIGGCASCAFQPDETLEGLCARNYLNVGEVIEHIETSHRAGRGIATPARRTGCASPSRGRSALLIFAAREEFEATHLDGAVLFSQPVMQEILGHWPRTELMVHLRSSRPAKPGRRRLFHRSGLQQGALPARRHRRLVARGGCQDSALSPGAFNMKRATIFKSESRKPCATRRTWENCTGRTRWARLAAPRAAT